MGTSTWVPLPSAEARWAAGRGAHIRRIFPVGALLLCALPGACTSEAPLPELTLRFVADASDDSFGHFVFGPLTESLAGADAMEDLRTQFNVFVGDPVFQDESCAPKSSRPSIEADATHKATLASSQPPLIGKVQRKGDGIEFIPRFPLSTERIYTACIDLNGLTRVRDLTQSSAGPLRHIARSPIKERSTVSHLRVTEVWPAAGRVPANLLRIYVEFDRPMEARRIGEQVALLRNGAPIEDAFVAIPDGLWGPEAKRLTLFLHPGRIKRGVGPHETLGPVLVAGDRVTLRLGAGLRSDDGVKLNESYEVDYLIAEDDRDLPAPSSWLVEPPRSATEHVRIVFDEPLDVGILYRFAEIRDGQGRSVEGRQAPSRDGLSWSFTPRNPWPPGVYQIFASSEIEDRAGNTPLRAFDRETGTSRAPETSSGFDPSAENLAFEFRVD